MLFAELRAKRSCSRHSTKGPPVSGSTCANSVQPSTSNCNQPQPVQRLQFSTCILRRAHITHSVSSPLIFSMYGPYTPSAHISLPRNSNSTLKIGHRFSPAGVIAPQMHCGFVRLEIVPAKVSTTRVSLSATTSAQNPDTASGETAEFGFVVRVTELHFSALCVCRFDGMTHSDAGEVRPPIDHHC